ncbi:MAG: ABC transporter ATP-binding protein [Clostridia bacterium]|nr:ABC transporter ATP-binding protein [Clostridia bacterium]
MKLILKDIRKSFERKEVLKKINFEFEEGKIYGLLGRNGAGKTTLFNCINEDMELSDGTFYLQENNQKIKIKPEDIGYVMSIPVVPKFLTGREFLKFFIDINNEKVADLKTEDEYFDMINIEKEDRDKLINDYSLGMQNKMQMIVNIMFNSKVLLLDEPLTSLDVVASEEIKDILKRIKKEHIIILSTHIMDLALDLCDEIVLLNNGILEKVHRNDLDDTNFKDKIINALKEEK